MPEDRHILDPDLLAGGVPHELYRDIRRRDPVYWQERPDDGGYWALMKHEDVVAVSRDPVGFSSQAGGMFIEDLDELLPTLLNLDPPAHGEVRRPLIDAFSPKAAGALETFVRTVAIETFTRTAEAGDCDFAADVAGPLPLRTIGRILGIPDDDLPRIGHWSDVLAAADDPELAGDLEGKRQNEAAMELGMYAYELGQRMRRAGADAGGNAGEHRNEIVALLMRSTIDGRPVELPAFCGLFVQILIGGNETTRSLLCGGMQALLENLDAYRALEADPSLIPVAVEEMLRWVTPVHYFRRTATRETEIRGVRVREGDRVVLMYASADRDEDVFPRPDVFDIHRNPNPHLAFGFGEHFCLGARVARMEARVFFEELFRRVASIQLRGPVERVRSNQLNSTKRMPVHIVAR